MNRLYVRRTRVGIGIISCEGCIKSEVNKFRMVFQEYN